ncbi:MAG: MafI family immunity protein [Actinomycetota bacterium]|nr:MafI family immunity protein [Actinomycetota bacterium]
MNPEQITSFVRTGLIGLEGRLRVEDLKEGWGLNEAGEPGVALELVCTQAYEYDVVVPHTVMEQIVEAGETMHLDPGLWKDLAVEP